MIVPLAALKAHLRVSGDDEDELIQSYGEAAERLVSQWLQRPIYAPGAPMPAEDEAGHDEYQMVAGPEIVVAVKQLVHRMFDQRGGDGTATDDAEPPQTVRMMLWPFRVFSRG